MTGLDKTSVAAEIMDISALADAERQISIALYAEPPALVCANKRRKLAPLVRTAVQTGVKTLVSFGGAYSNHLHALAHAGAACGLTTVGIVRGEASYSANATLASASAAGMTLRFVSRTHYRRRHDPDYIQNLRCEFPESLIVPEGGFHADAVTACAEWIKGIATKSHDVVCCAVGTGATFAGVINALSPDQSGRGYCVVGDIGTHDRIMHHTASGHSTGAQWTLTDVSAPGYARLHLTHYECIDRLYRHSQVLLDPVYTCKLVAGVISDVNLGVFKPGTRLLLIHTGGHQGWHGIIERAERTGIDLPLRKETLGAVHAMLDHLA